MSTTVSHVEYQRQLAGGDARGLQEGVVLLVFLRDWHPVLRDPLDLFRLSFPIGAVIFAHPGRLGRLRSGCSSPGVRGASRCGRSNVPRADRLGLLRRDVLPGLGRTRCTCSASYWWYDNTVHITLPDEPGADPLHRLLARWTSCPTRPSASAAAGRSSPGWRSITACLGVTAASFYEIYEWVVDNWFGQHLFIGETDTVTDLADGFLGAGIGGLFLAVWATARDTSRRLPSGMERRILDEGP